MHRLTSRPLGARLKRIALILFLLCLTLALSGCSTTPRTAPFNPPAAAMMKSRPLPVLKDDPAKPDDAASTVGLAELADDRLVTTRLYRDLARRHDALVDAVAAFLARQAK